MRGDRARSALAGTRFADVRWVAETGSTNRDLLELAAQGAPDGVVLVADHQTAGRGRLDRVWQAPPGGSLLVSILFRPGGPPADAHLLTTAVGVSAAEACRLVPGAEPLLKWPNDLVVSDEAGAVHKLSGILAESVVDAGVLRAAVVGLGLNVNWPPELPDDLRDVATALNHVVGNEVDREDLLIALLGRLDEWIGLDLAAGGIGRQALMDRARALSATIGTRVRVDLGAEQVVGRAVDLADDGALLIDVEDADGSTLERRAVVVGDVVHLRPVA